MESEENHIKPEEQLSVDIEQPAEPSLEHGLEDDHEPKTFEGPESTLNEGGVSDDFPEQTDSPTEELRDEKEFTANDVPDDGEEVVQDPSTSVGEEDGPDVETTDLGQQAEESTEVVEKESDIYIENPESDSNKHEGIEVDEPEVEEPVESVEDDDDDFGSFDEASFEEFQEPEPIENDQSVMFGSAVMNDAVLFGERLEDVLESVLPKKAPETSNQDTTPDLLTEGGSEKLKTFSTLPRLNPPNWTRLKMRHGLLVSLGVPINLDELSSTHVPPTSKPTSRRRSTTENDIQWGDFIIPEFESLNISADRKDELMALTLSILSKIEDNNLNNTTQQFLSLCSEEVVDEKYREMQENYAQLVELSSIWQAQIQELRNSQEMFESVVQNMVGYRQKLQRNEILESLSKSKRGKRVF